MIKPPTMVMPSGRLSSEPVLVLNTSGSAPNIAARVVIKMGRNRRRQAGKIASVELLPSSRSAASAKSIIIMAFFFTIPMSSRMPISAMTLRSVRNSISASTAPTPAEGSVDRMVTGWM